MTFTHKYIAGDERKNTELAGHSRNYYVLMQFLLSNVAVAAAAAAVRIIISQLRPFSNGIVLEQINANRVKWVESKKPLTVNICYCAGFCWVQNKRLCL